MSSAQTDEKTYTQEEEEETLNCENCKNDIIRDSEEHNNCIIGNSGEKIYCKNCVVELYDMLVVINYDFMNTLLEKYFKNQQEEEEEK